MANLLLQAVRDTVRSMEKADEERARDIGARIKARRLELGLKQEELADRAGASKSFISEVEGGRSVAGGIVYLNIAKALDLNVHYLLTGESLSAEEQVDVFQRVPSVSLVADELGWSHRQARDVAEALSRIVARRTRDGRPWVPTREQILAVARALEDPEK
jgi:transcriptional regulator with XRE-family HTH domain